MPREIKVYKVAAFIKNGSGGSPTAVVLNSRELSDADMQLIANQTSVSHTAFVIEPDLPAGNVNVRFFTEAGEILNCGHGTIAAHYTRAKIYNYEGNKSFFQQAKEEIQQVDIIQQENDIEIYLHQNEILFSNVNSAAVEALLAAVSMNKNELATDLPVIFASPGSNRFLVGIRSTAILNSIKPDFDTLKSVCSANNSIGCFVFAVDSLKQIPQLTARMFAPSIGVNEDVINGNSSGCLGAYWLQSSNENAIELHISQGQKFGLDGLVKVKATKNKGSIKTVIAGGARITGEFFITI